MSTALYRAFDGEGKLLYVGISKDALNRFKSHLRTSGWSGKCARLDICYFDARSEAIEAEKAAIQSERPHFNKVWAKSEPLPESPPVREAGPTRFLTPKSVCSLIALSRSTLDRLVNSGQFPRPIKITERRIAFVESEVLNWLDLQMCRRSIVQ